MKVRVVCCDSNSDQKYEVSDLSESAQEKSVASEVDRETIETPRIRSNVSKSSQKETLEIRQENSQVFFGFEIVLRRFTRTLL